MLAIVAASAVLWLLALIRLDPYRGLKGTTRRVVWFFLLGMLSVVPAILLSVIVPAASPTEEPSFSNLLLFVGVYAPIEEFSKFLVFLLLATGFRSLREPSDGIYQAAAVGLGFAILENIQYGVVDGPAVALARSFITPLRHMVYAAIWGLAYAERKFGRPRLRVRDVAVMLLFIAPASAVHGLSNYLANVGFGVQSVFGIFFTTTSFLVLREVRRRSPFVLRNLGRSGEALASISAALVHDPLNPHLHLRAAHFRLRAGDATRAVHHLDRYLSSRPDDPYGLGLQGAAYMLCGNAEAGASRMSRARAAMRPETWRLFARNVRRIIAPGRGRRPGGYGEFILSSWLDTVTAARERTDPRRVPPRFAGPADPGR